MTNQKNALELKLQAQLAEMVQIQETLVLLQVRPRLCSPACSVPREQSMTAALRSRLAIGDNSGARSLWQQLEASWRIDRFGVYRTGDQNAPVSYRPDELAATIGGLAAKKVSWKMLCGVVKETFKEIFDARADKMGITRLLATTYDNTGDGDGAGGPVPFDYGAAVGDPWAPPLAPESEEDAS